MKKSVFVLLASLFHCHAFAAPSALVTVEPIRVRDAKVLTALIQKQLPPGWKATYPDPDFGGGIEIKRLQPTAIRIRHWPSEPGSNGKPPAPTPVHPYTYFIGVEPFVDPADYRAWDACNRETRQRMEEAVTGLRWGKGYYMTRTPEDTLRVDRYEQLRKSLHNLPDYYWGHISLSKVDIAGIPEYDLVEDEKVKQECKDVTLAALNLLKVYETAPPTNNAR